MEKVVTFSLNGNAYQIDENGFEKIVAYLNHAKAQLKNHDDADEIIGDLEQAIAEKCARYLNARKNVIKASEIDQVIAEMGPVVVDTETENKTATEPEVKAESGKKRLYQIQEGAWITGLCKGISVYTGIEVMAVRALVAVAILVSQGFGFVAYLAAILLVPFAKTGEDHAAAEGLPFNAQSLVDRAIHNYSTLKDDATIHKRWHGHYGTLRARFNEETQSWMRGFKRDPAYETPITAGALVMMPIFGMIKVLLFVAFIVALVGVTTQGLLFAWALPSTIPLWAAVVGLVVVYKMLSAPFSLANFGPGRHYRAWRVKSGVLETAITVFAFWFAYQNIPEVRHFVRELPESISMLVEWIRSLKGSV